MKTCVMFAAATWALCGLGAEFVVAERGKTPDCTIVLPAEPGPSERFAAEEFRDWTEKLVGVKLPIVQGAAKGKCVCLNPATPSTFPAFGSEDEFALEVRGEALNIRGGRRGVLYGVYEVLERFGGILWLSSTFTHLPKADALEIPSDLRVFEKPDFAMRDQDASARWGMGVHAARMRNNRITADMKLGSWHAPFDRVLGTCHTFLRLVPPAKYFDSHPEYFSFFKGKRQSGHTQLCLTNPDVYEIVLSNVLARIEANRSETAEWRRATKYYGISQDDWNGYCECPNCAAIDEREGSHSGCVIWFVNKIAEAVEKKYPDVMIETLAYMYSRVPPKHLKPRKNVMICLCTIECDFTKPIEENRNEENVRFRDSILKWREISNELFVWDYIANWRATPSPEPNLRTLAKNVRFFRDAGVTCLFEEGIVGPHAAFSELKGWLCSKLMWDADQPAGPLVEKFVRAYYGKGAPYVLDYIRLLESFPIDETKSAWTYARTVQQLPFDDAFYAKALSLWRQALEAAKDDAPAIREHCEWGVFGIEYTLADRYAQGGAWRPVIAAPSLAAKVDRAEFELHRGYARHVMEMLKREPAAMVSSRLNDARLKGVIRALAEAELPKAEETVRVRLQDWAFSYSDHPRSTTIFRVDDKDATDGRALSVKKDGSGWKVTCRFNEAVALEPGRTYRMRARLKVQPESGAKPERNLLTFGLFDRKTKKTVTEGGVKAAQATGEYAWCDFFREFRAEDTEYILYVDPRDATFSLDCLEIVSE